MFPDKFEFTVYIIMSMCCLLTGIYLYETKKAVVQVVKGNVDKSSEKIKPSSNKGQQSRS